jgi:formiminotetrahydrofolate cyclodeaminase
MEAFKLPKTTAEEKTVRSRAFQEEMKKAVLLPMEAAESCVLVMELALDALRCGKSSTASDAAVAGRMAYAGLWGAVYNVRINLASIKDEDFCTAARDQVHTLLDKSRELHAILTALADEKIA